MEVNVKMDKFGIFGAIGIAVVIAIGFHKKGKDEKVRIYNVNKSQGLRNESAKEKGYEE